MAVTLLISYILLIYAPQRFFCVATYLLSVSQIGQSHIGERNCERGTRQCVERCEPLKQDRAFWQNPQTPASQTALSSDLLPRQFDRCRNFPQFIEDRLQFPPVALIAKCSRGLTPVLIRLKTE